MKRAKKKRVPCSTCGRKLWRLRARKATQCPKCCAAYQLRWEHANPEKMAAKWNRFYERNKVRLNIARGVWRRLHAEIAHKTEKRYRARLRIAADEVDAAVDCVCGSSHAFDRRAAILRRMLPTTAREIREVWSCIWGSPDMKDAGSRRLYRDLEKIGALREGGTFYLRESRAA